VRCLTCDAQMQLVEVIDDTTVLVSGYNRQMWCCWSCGDVERRMVFARAKTVASNVPMTTHRDESTTKDGPHPSAWNQAVNKLRNRLKERELLAAKVSDGIQRFKEKFADKHDFDQLWENLAPRRQD
jgi:hypothetical protein